MENQNTEEQEEYTNTPIYLTLNGNDWRRNSFYLQQCLNDSRTYHRPLYVTSNIGGPNEPPPCPPGQICKD